MYSIFRYFSLGLITFPNYEAFIFSFEGKILSTRVLRNEESWGSQYIISICNIRFVVTISVPLTLPVFSRPDTLYFTLSSSELPWVE